MQEEQVILVNEKDEVLGYAPKMLAHEKALLHRAFSVFIFNDKGELLLQQRAAHKYHSPRLWTNTVCSHQRKDEANIDAGKRRLMEEMGMIAELKEVFHFVYKAPFDNGLTEHELDHVMIGFSNKLPEINLDEVMNYTYESLENIEADINKHPENYTEWFKIIFANSLDKLKKELVIKMLQIPLEFEPIYKEKPWGGSKLKSILNKNISSNHTGESWEISNVPGNISIVKSGYFKGQNLQKLIRSYKTLLVGQANYKKYEDNFPLLFKYIDANADLSIQVHPNDEIAFKKHQSTGKNELWQIIHADKNAVLYIGFKKGTSREDYLKALQKENLESILNKIEVKEDDIYYIPAGTVHSIGKGILLAEIQQSSDITYRIYDWNRPGLDGKPRELHTELALKAIDFTAQPDKRNSHKIDTPYFQIEKIDVTSSKNIDISNISSFIILMNTGIGDFNINGIDFKKGKTLLISANTSQININIIKPGEFLMIYIL